MIPFAPINTREEVWNRIQDVIEKSFSLCVSLADLAAAFRSAQPGTQTLTLGTTAPDYIQTLTPTRWLQITESDGKVTTIVGYR